jgi:hypothetical protein
MNLQDSITETIGHTPLLEPLKKRANFWQTVVGTSDWTNTFSSYS